MGFTERKLEISILALSTVVVIGVGYMLKAPVQAVLADPDVVYEMPRPKNSILAALFDLADREVSRKYVNPFAKKTAEAKKEAEAAKSAAVPAKKTVAKAKTIEKKKEDLKKNVEVKIVGDTPRSTLGDDSVAGNGPGSERVAKRTQTEPVPQEDTQNKNTMSADQWRALLMAQPTKENVAKLIAAYHGKEVEDQTFYMIVTDLFRSNKSETQSLGLMAVKSAYNVQSFSVTAQYYDQLAPEVQMQAHTYLMSYAVSARLPILASALQSSNKDVVSTAAEVVMEGYKNAKNGVSLPASDPRSSRGDIVVNSVSGYSKFIPIFQQLAQSQDPTIAGLAHTALNQIQTNVAAL